MASIEPQMPNSVPVSESEHANPAQGKQKEVQAARKNLLEAMWQASVAPRFSSKPIDIEDYFSERGGAATSPPTPTHDFRNSLVSSSNLTTRERDYLNNLLQSDDLGSIRRASLRLADKELFPSAEEEPENSTEFVVLRDSELQQQLFRLHEKSTVQPSTVLKKINSSTRKTMLSPEAPREGLKCNSVVEETESDVVSPQAEKPGTQWSPFNDVDSWIDESKEVEVGDEGNSELSPTSNPFKILGTSADDISCYPHVLSPPLMEGLQSFMPESLHDYHFWLKYSLARDGGNLKTMLRHCRASLYTVLAIETTQGHVFGSFTSQPWRLVSTDFYGGKDSFVWRMRRSRNDECKSIIEQVLLESQIDVFPFTSANSKVQFCSREQISLGENEVEDMNNLEGTHFTNAICLNHDMKSGSTSTSETFGNPCLIQSNQRGKEFEVGNIEVWAMTPHTSVEASVRSEMNMLFLEEGRNAEKSLNLLGILIGGA